MAIRQLACSRFKYPQTRAVLTLMGVKLREVQFAKPGSGLEITIGIEHDSLVDGTELMGLMFLPESGAGVMTFHAILTTLAALIAAAKAGAVAISTHQVTPASLS